jgi:hypothetical protein
MAVGLAVSISAFSAAPLKKHMKPKPPKGAIVLFNGKDTSKWVAAQSGGQPFRWRVADGYMEVVPGAGNIETVPRFTDFQLHVEFNVPSMPDAHGQGRGNSGVYLQGLYEIQVLDSFNNDTYANGACGAVYGEYPPRVNASKPPEQWQTYDIWYTAPRFDTQGNVTQKPRVTVYQNDTLIQDNVEIQGATTASGSYDRTQAGPIMLQDHGCKVKYRNLWIKPTSPMKK